MKFLGKVLLVLVVAGVAGFFLVDDSQKKMLVTRAKVATGLEKSLPEGTVLIIERVAVPTDSGSRSVAAGTVVELVEDRGRSALLRDSAGEFEATLDQFTADSAIASMLREQWKTDGGSNAP